jgi:diamine N-acetyltransferase
MSVRLVPIDAKNWRAYVALEVEPGQEHFVAPNVFSMAQAKAEAWWEIAGVSADDVPVGFVMFGRVPDDGRYWVCRLMVDRAHQRRGYGRAAMELVLAELRSREDCADVWISFEPENAGARDLYVALGFEDQHRVEEGESVYKLTVGGHSATAE